MRRRCRRSRLDSTSVYRSPPFESARLNIREASFSGSSGGKLHFFIGGPARPFQHARRNPGPHFPDHTQQFLAFIHVNLPGTVPSANIVARQASELTSLEVKTAAKVLPVTFVTNASPRPLKK
jgi:hypothetical protein